MFLVFILSILYFNVKRPIFNETSNGRLMQILLYHLTLLKQLFCIELDHSATIFVKHTFALQVAFTLPSAYSYY